MVQDIHAMDGYMKASRALWDEWARINHHSDFYRVDAFKAGLRLRNDPWPGSARG